MSASVFLCQFRPFQVLDNSFHHFNPSALLRSASASRARQPAQLSLRAKCRGTEPPAAYCRNVVG